MKLTRDQIEALRALRPGPLVVRKNSRMDRSGFVVVNSAGDAELGNWTLAECRWEKDAEAFASLHHLADTALAALDRVAELEAALKPFAEAFGIALSRAKTQTLGEINALASHHLHGAAFKNAHAALEPES